MQDDKRETSLEVNNEKALRQLAWAIENAAGKFKLILARCNYASLRSRLISKLQEICQVEISVLQLRESGRTLYSAIHQEFEDKSPAALMVLGLESVPFLSQMLTSANQVREEFRKHFPFPLVLWINDDVYKQLMQFAPDLESWATSKNFAIAPDELANELRDIANSWFSNNLRLGEDDYLILSAELEAAHRDLLGDEEFFTLELQAVLESLLGLVKRVNNQKDTAIEHYQKSLNLWQRLNNLERQLKILNDIADCYYLKSLRIPDKTHPDWQATKYYIQEYLNLIYLNLFSDHQQHKLIANASINFGEALRDLEEWEALERLVNLALEIHQAENQPLDLARDYGFLAEVALAEERWQDAKNFACQALDVLSPISSLESPDTSGIIYELEEESVISYDASLYKFILAKSQYHLGNKSEAIRNLETARELSEPLQGLRLYLDILKHLQKLYFEGKEYLKAYDIKQEQFSVEQQFGLRAFIGAGRLQSFKGEAFSTQHKYRETIAPEIAASTRQLDVERLIERVGRNDCKLIVIYGQSGVGKSSLVNAGLEPALKNKAIGIKDNLPVVMRVYTNWQEELTKQIAENLSPNLSPCRREALNSLNSPPSLAGKGVGGLGSTIFQQLAVNEERNIRTVLIFDQFEEFFFVCTEPAQRREFMEFLAECLNVLSVKVILSLRVDYLHYLLECNKLPNMKIIGSDILSNNVLYELGNFTPSDAKSIIQRLTQSANFPLEPGLIDKLVEDLAGALVEVRPIELQIVGAQLQTENINTLAKYGLLGDKAKEELVKRYLEAVVENCGTENIQVAELLLYSLTDEKGTRPLKTRIELERNLEDVITPTALSRTLPSQLDLVLEILVKSGLVLVLPEKPDDRYQLVHDYIAAFIRQQQEPKLKEELQREREQRKASEIKLNKFLKRALAGSIAAGFGFAVLAVTAGYQAWEVNKQKQQADVNAVEAQLNSSEAFFNSGETYDASVAALKARETLKQGKGVTTANQMLTTAVLRQAIYNYAATERTLTWHSDSVYGVAWSADGKTLASASRDKTIKLWDATTSKLLKTLTGHSDGIIGVAWNPDGKTLASASNDKTIKLWDATTGKQIKTLIGHSDEVIGVAWSPDGKTLASASWDKTIKLWDATTGKLLKTLAGHNNGVIGVAWNPDGKTFASASRDNTIKLWDATTGKLLKTLAGHNNGVIGVAWSTNGKTLASASRDKTIKLWDVTTGKLLKTLTGHSNLVWGVAWSADGKTLASASRDKTIKLWDVTTGKLLKTLTKHSGEVFGVAWSADSKTLASASRDKTIKLWDVTTGKLLKTLTKHSGEVFGVAWNPDGKILASASADKTIKLWDATTGKQIKTLTGHSERVISVAWSADGKTLASASRDKTIKLWDATTGKQIKTLTGHSDVVIGVAWNPDGKTLASASADKTIKLWDATTGKQIKTLTGHSDGIIGVAWSPDGKTLASASADKTIKLWDATTGKLLKTHTGHSDGVTSVAWSPDGKTLASASRDKTIKLWDATTGKQIKTLTGHSDVVIGVAWNPDGKTLASASADKTIKLWDATTGKQIKTLTEHSDAVYGVAWNPDGKTLASGSWDNTIILWDFDFDNLIKSACSRLENYLPFHPEALADLKVCQTRSLLARTAEVLVVQGEEQAKNGDVETAVAKFREAQKWNPQLNFDPEKKARELHKQGQGK
jgi:WD40 repeat protein